jgi:F-type H+-transporting ATPase subunit b
VDINATLLGQAISFILLVVFTMKFIWPPLNNMLEERAKRIADGLAAADRGQEELQKAAARITEELQHAQIGAAKIIANSEKHGEQLVNKAIEKANLESAKILAEARVQVEQEIIKAREELRSQVAVLAVEGAKQILHAEIDAAKHEKILSTIKMGL